ncbi:MAG TPA: 4'-phosphopantetheinyl transferase superfamily protein [Firmicutes bacterium]|nr:4'-phosphopantetheinyl transferase superfamily protein [Bacillota bacterium]
MVRALPPARREAAARRRGAAQAETVAASYLALYALLAPAEAVPSGPHGPVWPAAEELLGARRAVARLAERAGWPVGPYGQPFPHGCPPAARTPGGGRTDGIPGVSAAGGSEARAPARYVSLSHSQGVAAAAACLVPVGLDLQGAVPQETERLLRIARKLHPAERERLAALPPAALPGAFRRLWAAKESVLKLCGRGLSLPLSAFAVREDGTGQLDGRTFRIAGWETKAGSLAAAVWAEGASGIDGLEAFPAGPL